MPCYTSLLSLKQYAQAKTTKDLSFWKMISKKRLRISSERNGSIRLCEEHGSECKIRIRLRKQQGSEGLVQCQEETWSEKESFKMFLYDETVSDPSEVSNEDLSQGSVMTCTSLCHPLKIASSKRAGKPKVSHQTVAFHLKPSSPLNLYYTFIAIITLRPKNITSLTSL